MKGRIGRHRTNLFDAIMNDLKCRSIEVGNDVELNELVDIANDRKLWKELFSRDKLDG